MLFRLKPILWLLSISIISSCGTSSYNLVHYVPNEPNMLKISEKGQIKISASTKSSTEDGDRDKYRNVQIGYSPKHNIGVHYGHYYFRKSTGNSIFRLNNLSIGWYKFKSAENKWRYLNFNANVKGWLYELYGGVGYGIMKNMTFEPFTYPKTIVDDSTLKIAQFYIRGGIHRQSEALGMSLSLTAGRINYFGGSINFGDQSDYLLYREFFNEVVDNNRGFFIAPSSKISIGPKDLNLYFGGTYQKVFSDSDLETKKNIIYVGLSANIIELSQIFKRRKKRKELKNMKK